MHIYLIGYFLLLIGAFLWERTYPKIRLIYILGLIYVSIIVILRGDVGTDTGTYEAIISGISLENWRNQPTELGFNFYIALLNLSNLPSNVILRIVVATYIGLLLLALITAEKNIRQLLVVFIIPATIYIFAMNGLRIGLAMNLLIISLNTFKNNRALSILIYGLALSFHITVIISLPILFLFQKNNSKKIIFSFLLILILTTLLALYSEHITQKLILYSNYASPSSLSGLSDIVTFCLLILFFSLYPINGNYKISFILTLSILVIGAFILARFSYAGLRLLQLYVLISPILYLHIANTKFRISQLNKHAFWCLFITSCITILFTLRNFAASAGQEYGFLPYSFLSFN